VSVQPRGRNTDAHYTPYRSRPPRSGHPSVCRRGRAQQTAPRGRVASQCRIRLPGLHQWLAFLALPPLNVTPRCERYSKPAVPSIGSLCKPTMASVSRCWCRPRRTSPGIHLLLAFPPSLPLSETLRRHRDDRTDGNTSRHATTTPAAGALAATVRMPPAFTNGSLFLHQL
jgi:hypothetical protein